jgi:hypothetical protein
LGKSQQEEGIPGNKKTPLLFLGNEVFKPHGLYSLLIKDLANVVTYYFAITPIATLRNLKVNLMLQ